MLSTENIERIGHTTGLHRIGTIASTLNALRAEVRTKASNADLAATAAFLGEFLEYLLFLVVLLVVAINMNGLPKAFPLVQNLQRLVLGYPDYPYAKDGSSPSESFLLYENVKTQDETWVFVRDQLGSALFSDENATDAESRFLLDGAHLKLGAIRLVTTRVSATWENCVSLPVYRDFNVQPYIRTCYPRPTSNANSWDASPFGTPDGYFQVNPELFDISRLSRFEEVQAESQRLGVRRLRAGGGGDGAGRRGVADGTGGEVETPESALFKLDVPFDMRRHEWERYVDGLREHGFLDEQSRVFEILFTVYNVQSNLYCSITIDITFPFTGGAAAAATFYTIEPVRHLTFISRRGSALFPQPSALDGLKLLAEIIFLLLVLRSLYLTVRKAIRAADRIRADAVWTDVGATPSARVLARVRAVANIIDPWSLLHDFSLLLHLIVVVRRFSVLDLMLSLDLAPSADRYVDFHRLADDMYTTQNITSLNALFSCLSLFKFATVVPHLSMLNRTIATAFSDLVGFLLMFSIVFLGFMQAFQLSFGSDLREFAGGSQAFYTLFGVLSGDVNLVELRAANKFLGPLLFLGYAVFIIFVLLNMFVAIVTSAYAKAKKDLKEDPTTGKLYNTLQYTLSIISQVTSKQYKFLLLALSSKKTQREIDQAIKDGLITRMELRVILKGSGLGDESTTFKSWRYWSAPDLVMQRYDPDGNGWIFRKELISLRVDMAAESELRRKAVEEDFAENDQGSRIERECGRRMRVYQALIGRADELLHKNTQLLNELDSSRKAIQTALGLLTNKLWDIWERCDLI